MALSNISHFMDQITFTAPVNHCHIGLVQNAVKSIFNLNLVETGLSATSTLCSESNSFDNNKKDTEEIEKLSSSKTTTCDSTSSRSIYNNTAKDEQNKVPIQEIEKDDLIKNVEGGYETNKTGVLSSGSDCSSASAGNRSTGATVFTILPFENAALPSLEEFEEAKSFARVHLQAEPDYTTSVHVLGNQQEFHMVLETSPGIQKTTCALLVFDPDSLAVTLKGPKQAVLKARSQIVMILDNQRQQHRAGGRSIQEDDEGPCSYDSFNLDNFVQNDNNNKPGIQTRMFQNGHGLSQLTNNLGHHGEADSVYNNFNLHKLAQYNQSQPNWNLIQPDINNSDDIEFDSARSPTEHILPAVSPLTELRNATQAGLVPYLSEDESSCDESVLSDPRYNKRIEQAVKLGYTEKQVQRVLTQLGPDCATNDLLSALITLGASDSGSPPHPWLLSEQQVLCGQTQDDYLKHRLEPMWSEPEEPPRLLSSGDSLSSSGVDPSDISNLRHIIIDGSNVAMSHGKKVFSCRGIKIAVDWFKDRGHRNITAFVPQWRKETSRPDAPITDQDILADLEKDGIVVFTPARRVKGKRVVCYDDRYVLKLAVDTDGIVVSNDVYRDLVNEREDFRQVVEQRLLMFSFVNDRFMPPEDPLGRMGPTLDNFLRKIPAEPVSKPQDCPYGKKCTYGNKCRFYHPERGFAPQKSVTETLKEQADAKLQERASRLSEMGEKSKRSKQKLSRTKSLLPWESQVVPGAPIPASSAAKGSQEKPKLVHSKSLVLSTKDPDYLNEHRKKLEEAELSAAVGKLTTQTSYQQRLVSPPLSSNNTEVKAPPLVSDSSHIQAQLLALKQEVAATDSMGQEMCPLKSASTSSSRMYPTHLMVPSPEVSEGGYLSGHLYLAKKLSDESNESSFFSEHTSSPSSTRNTSPIIPVSKLPEQKRFPLTDATKVRTGSRFFAFPPSNQTIIPELQNLLNSGLAEHADLPNLSIFDMGTVLETRSNISNMEKTSVVESTKFSPGISQKLPPISPDSGLYTSTESMASPGQTMLETPLTMQPSTHPYFTPEQAPLIEHHSVRRAFSSADQFKTTEGFNQKLTRRASGFSSSFFEDNNNINLKPSQEHYSKTLQGQLHGLNRQNSSSDPQMHLIGDRDLRDLYSPSATGTDSAANFSHFYSTANPQYHQPQSLPQHHHHNHQRHPESTHFCPPQQQANLLPVGPRIMAKPPTAVWNEAATMSTGLGYRTSHSGPGRNKYTPFINITPSSGRIQNVVTHSGQYNPYTPDITMSSSYMPTTSPLTQPPPSRNYFQPHLAYFDPSLQPPPFNPNRQVKSNYPAAPFYLASSIPGPVILPEDTPISPEDPRYNIYYHLSNVFTEQTVRRVMNRYPSVLNPGDVCQLIMQYQEEAGL